MFGPTGCWSGILISILFVTVAHSVRITKVTIPEYHVIYNEKPEPLVLDCEFEVDKGEENSLVIKWTFQGEFIYQWIPDHKPHVLRPHMKDKIDTKYQASNKPYHQYRALALVNPTWNLTGTYSCLIDTFESSDRKSGFLQIIDNSKTTIEICRNVVNDVEEISCIVSHVYPQPVLNLTLNDEPIPKKSEKVDLRSNGLFDVTTVASTPLLDSGTDGEIDCHVYFPKTNFTIQKALILSGTMKAMISSKLLTATTIVTTIIYFIHSKCF